MAKQITSETFRAFVNLDNGEKLLWEGLTYGQARWRYHWLARNIIRPLNGPRWKAYGYEMEGQAKMLACLTLVMRQLIQAANDSGATLEAAAIKNQHKIFDRWRRGRVLIDFPNRRLRIKELPL